jgi:uncharacterized protein (TIGR02147 family)
MKDVFLFDDYKAYLRERLDASQAGRGGQARLAAAVRCQPAYLSMVLRGKHHLSLEQAEAAARHLALGSDETDYFFALVQEARAGTPALQARFARERRRLSELRKDVGRRLGNQAVLPDDIKAVFYSAWYYTAVHLLLTIPGQRTPSAIAQYLRLPPETVAQVLEFLVRHGLAVAGGGEYVVGPTRLGLGPDSPFVAQSHKNWRQMAWQSLQRPVSDDFHYSSIVTMSGKDLAKLREAMVQCISEVRSVVRDSPEEDLYCYTLDVFSLKQ